jgi:hypothetical protein
MNFHAHCVHASINQEDEAILVGFADRHYDTKEYILFSRALNPSEQDYILGHESIHTEVNDQLYSFYDGIESIFLLKLEKKVIVEFAPYVLGELRLIKEPSLVISIQDENIEMSQIAHFLSLLAKGFTRFKEA